MEKEYLKKFLEYDYYAAPLFDGFMMALTKNDIEKISKTDIFPGAHLYKIVDEFIPFYRAKCQEFNIEPEEIVQVSKEDYLPYCPAVTAAILFEDTLGCMLFMQDFFGDYQDQIIENIINSDELMKLTRQMDANSDLRKITESFADILITVDKIFKFAYSMGEKVLDEKWQDIADVLNVYVDKLNEAHITKELNHFTTKDVIEFSQLADLYAIEPVKKKNGAKWGLDDILGDEILPCEWDYIGEFHEGLAVVSNNGKGAGYINVRGEIVISCIWNLAMDFENGHAVVSNNENKYGIINRKGEIVIPCEWRFITPFQNGIAKAQDFDEHWFLVDTNGKATRTDTKESSGTV